jgi:hypothetical protein
MSFYAMYDEVNDGVLTVSAVVSNNPNKITLLKSVSTYESNGIDFSFDSDQNCILTKMDILAKKIRVLNNTTSIDSKETLAQQDSWILERRSKTMKKAKSQGCKQSCMYRFA